MSDYTDDIDSAYEDIAEDGTAAVLEWEGLDEVDVVTDVETDSGDVSTAVVQAALFPLRPSDDVFFAPDTRETQEQQRFLLAGKGIPVKVVNDMMLYLTAVPWKIVSCSALSPNNQGVILYKGVVRR